ncbi:MAG: hypothetical protein J07HQW2_00698 [Haloquadratum walsbyi J07HQW2]|uniref:Uncharacterized protein n=1 Tax=Haloquadratum walsbyi J07HQW2 TaxID=1238425 RepID=U1MV33_9EURY|nr:MAG: hypothetical protein J07HQW2_00698 [Haloquadratum walsbyi J07HQW2]
MAVDLRRAISRNTLLLLHFIVSVIILADPTFDFSQMFPDGLFSMNLESFFSLVASSCTGLKQAQTAIHE